MLKAIRTCAAAVAFAVALTGAAFAETVNVTFITASDMDTMSGKKRGGAARLAAVAKAERAKGGNVVYVYPGDLLSPSILAGFDQGKHMIELLNMEPPDILVPGNHEYDFGPKVFLARMAEGKFAKLATNTRQADGSMLPGFEDTKMMEFGGIKIGFMGLTTDRTRLISSPGDIQFMPPVEVARKTGDALREQGADMVVAIVHTAMNVDFDLLNRANVDVVLSGHDHNLHVFFDGRRALVESKEEAEYVTMMDIEFEIGESRGKRRVSWWPNYRIIDTATVTPDPDVQARVAEYEADLSEELDVKLGESRVELDSRKASVRTGETVIGNLVADAMRVAVDADIAITNGGGIRGNRVYEPGHTVTRRDILTELPFGNVNVKLEASGAVVMEALEHGAARAPEAAGSFLQVSNLTYVIDTSKPAGERVSNVMIGGAPLDMDKTYSIATNDFMARGGDGYGMLRGANVLIDKDSAKLMANDVMVFIRKNSGVDSKIEGRVTVK